MVGEGGEDVGNDEGIEIKTGNGLENSRAYSNTMRHVLRGDFPEGLVYSKIKIEVASDSLKIKFLSLEDGSVLKEWEAIVREGDSIELLGVVASYRLSFMEL